MKSVDETCYAEDMLPAEACASFKTTLQEYCGFIEEEVCGFALFLSVFLIWQLDDSYCTINLILQDRANMCKLFNLHHTRVGFRYPSLLVAKMFKYLHEAHCAGGRGVDEAVDAEGSAARSASDGVSGGGGGNSGDDVASDGGLPSDGGGRRDGGTVEAEGFGARTISDGGSGGGGGSGGSGGCASGGGGGGGAGGNGGDDVVSDGGVPPPGGVNRGEDVLGAGVSAAPTKRTVEEVQGKNVNLVKTVERGVSSIVNLDSDGLYYCVVFLFVFTCVFLV